MNLANKIQNYFVNVSLDEIVFIYLIINCVAGTKLRYDKNTKIPNRIKKGIKTVQFLGQ